MNFPKFPLSSPVGQVAVPVIERVLELREASVSPITTLLTVIVAELRVVEIVQVIVAVAEETRFLNRAFSSTYSFSSSSSSLSSVRDAAAMLHVGVTPEGDDNVTFAFEAEIAKSDFPVIVNVYTEFEHEPTFTLFNVIVHVVIVITNKIYII